MAQYVGSLMLIVGTFIASCIYAVDGKTIESSVLSAAAVVVCAMALNIKQEGGSK